MLEVSCGHGGGSRHIARALGPRRMVGMDLTAGAVELCRASHVEPNLEFAVGNAVDLPFDDESFDVVISVEASHRYPSFDEFVRSATRVLRPGGHLMITDLRWRPGEREAMLHSLESSPLEVLEVEDIAPRVVASLEAYEPTRRRVYEAAMPRLLRKASLDSAGVPGSPIFRALENGSASYTRIATRKPSPATA